MRKLSMNELNRKTVEEFKEAKKNPLIVVLEDIRSVYNVGSVFRTADAFLVEAIWICGYTAYPPHKGIQKTALGADETVQWRHFKTAAEAVDELHQLSYKVYAAEQAEGSILLDKFSAKDDEKTAIVFGNEVEGITQETLKLCDGCIEIPQFGMKHSLNIATAAGIVIYKLSERLFANMQ